MPRVLRGNKRDLPAGMSPFEWANRVFAVMDDQGVGQQEAKQIVKDRIESGREDDEDEED